MPTTHRDLHGFVHIGDNMKTLSTAFLGLMLLAFYPAAQAEYVCSVNFNPNAIGTGNFGSVTIIKHIEPNCGGAFSGANIFCTKGATYGPCAESSYHYTERAILALYQSLVDAVRDNIQITITPAACINDGFGCGARVNFRAD